MLHQQNAIELFEVSRDQHARLLQEANQHRLLQLYQEATPWNSLFTWLRGRQQTPVIHEIQRTLTTSVN